VNEAQRELLSRLSLNDERAFLEVTTGSDPRLARLLDDTTRALVRLAGLITMGPHQTSLQAAVENGTRSGALSRRLPQPGPSSSLVEQSDACRHDRTTDGDDK
jgi:hypothetical protein